MAAKTNTHESHAVTKSEDKIMYIIAYLIPILTGLIVYFLYAETDKGLRFQAVQSILYSIAFIVVYVVLAALFFVIFFFAPFIGGVILGLFSLLAWLYGLYTGYKAYMGMHAIIPVVGDFAKRA